MSISSFSGPNFFLSNFYPTTIEYDGYKYRTLEHAYQAAKHPPEERYRIQQVYSPSAAKRVSLNKRLRDPSFKKMKIMELLLRQKFNKRGLGEALTETAPHDLVEDNDWGDTYWGTCDGVGENRLGQLLMIIRAELLR